MKRIILLVFIGCFCANLFAQKTITGIVRDASDNSTMPGVSIQIKGTAKGTVTDVDGNYSIRVQPDEKELTFSFLGMKSQTISIGNKTKIDVTMASDENVLDEVVVSALNINRPNKSLTVAQQRVNAETLAEVRDQNIVSSLAGKVAGVMVTPPASATGAARIVIRGNSSFLGNNEPLFVIDGMQIDNSNNNLEINKSGGLDLGNGASDINPDDIESIDVLKGPNAAALYGSRAANGVIIITTKKAKDGRFKVSASSNTMYRYISQWPEFQNAYGVGNLNQMIGGDGNILLVQQDIDGKSIPYPGLPTMEKMLTSNSSRSLGAPMLGQPYLGLDGRTVYYQTPQPGNLYDFYQTAYTNTNNVALEGGTIDNNYRVSFTNMNATDVIENQNKVARNTLNVRFFNTLLKNLTLDSKVTVTDDNTKNRRYANQSSYNPLWMYIDFPRSLTLDQIKNYKSDNGEEIVRLSATHNPYWIVNETENEDSKRRILANFDLSYQVLPQLRATLKYAREYFTTKRYEFRNKGAIGSNDRKGYYREAFNMNDNTMAEYLLIYNERFNDFSLVGTFGGSRNDYWDYWNSAEISSLKQAGLRHISNSDDPVQADENGYKTIPRKRLNSLYGSVSLGFKDYAYLDVTGRNDWSSTLPKANNSYFYPSFGVSVIPSEMFKVPTRTFYGKLRASYARVGNDTDPYRIVNYYSLGSNNVFNGYKYASIDGTLANSYLKPEITTSVEMGADLRFLNGRVNADITYYQSNSINQIVASQMASSSGYDQRMYNAGEIENNGWEVALRLIPVEMKTFKWEADINFTKNNSMVKSMAPGLDRIELSESIYSLYNVITVGKPYGSLYGTRWLRDNEGRLMVSETNGERVIKENTYLGNFNPDFLLGFSNHFRIKAFDIYVLLDMKKGGKLYSGTMRQAVRNGVISMFEKEEESYWMRHTIMGDGSGTNNWGGILFNEQGGSRFNNENIYYYVPARYDEDMNTYEIVYNTQTHLYEKAVDANGNWIPDPNYTPEKCDQYFWPGTVGYYADALDELIIYDASYVKLREISVGYNLPKRLISKIKMTNARISIVGRNLWTFYQKTPKGLDPEASINAGNGQGWESGSLPPSTTLGFDIKISF